MGKTSWLNWFKFSQWFYIVLKVKFGDHELSGSGDIRRFFVVAWYYKHNTINYTSFHLISKLQVYLPFIFGHQSPVDHRVNAEETSIRTKFQSNQRFPTNLVLRGLRSLTTLQVAIRAFSEDIVFLNIFSTILSLIKSKSCSNLLITVLQSADILNQSN